MVFGRVGGCYPKIGPKRHPSLIIAPVNFFKGRSKSAKSQGNIVFSFFFFMFWCVSLENLQNVLISFVKLIIYGEQDMFQSSGLISNVTLKLDALVNMYCLMISVMFSSWIGTLLSSSKCNFEMFFVILPLHPDWPIYKMLRWRVGGGFESRAAHAMRGRVWCYSVVLLLHPSARCLLYATD